MQIFLKNIHAFVCIYVYKIIIHKLLFWMCLIVIDRCPALVFSNYVGFEI